MISFTNLPTWKAMCSLWWGINLCKFIASSKKENRTENQTAWLFFYVTTLWGKEIIFPFFRYLSAFHNKCLIGASHILGAITRIWKRIVDMLCFVARLLPLCIEFPSIRSTYTYTSNFACVNWSKNISFDFCKLRLECMRYRRMRQLKWGFKKTIWQSSGKVASH